MAEEGKLGKSLYLLIMLLIPKLTLTERWMGIKVFGGKEINYLLLLPLDDKLERSRAIKVTLV